MSLNVIVQTADPSSLEEMLITPTPHRSPSLVSFSTHMSPDLSNDTPDPRPSESLRFLLSFCPLDLLLFPEVFKFFYASLS